jgi:hypothetical protein
VWPAVLLGGNDLRLGRGSESQAEAAPNRAVRRAQSDYATFAVGKRLTLG